MNEQFSSLRRRSFLITAAGALFGGAAATSVGARGSPPAADESGIAAVMYSGVDDVFDDESRPLDGSLFDMDSFRETGNGRVIHRELPLGDGKPYILKHEGNGRFTPRGAVINFEGPTDLWPAPGRWRTVVREEVQAAANGDFAWSATRVDFFERPNMEYAQSSLIIVWDDDLVEYPSDVIDDAADELKQAGTANPGGN